MNILLVNPPLREYKAANFHPFGLASVAAMLQQDGHRVEIFDPNRHRCEWEATEFPAGPWDWVGVSGLVTTYKWLTVTMPMMRKAYGDTPIVIGGGGASSAPEVYLENLKPDLVAIGEGEYTALDICKYLAGEMPLEDVKGVAYSEDGKPKFNAPRPVEWDLGKFPRQAYDLFDMAGYVENSSWAGPITVNGAAPRSVGMLATRGCNQYCSFCYKIWGRGIRYRDPIAVVDEMEFLLDKYNANVVGFNDECMSASRKFMVAFCEEIIRRGRKVTWGCQTRADALDDGLMALMAKAGCYRVGIGMESGSQKILDEMGKKTTPEVLRRGHMGARRFFPAATTTWIFGMPGEDDQSADETAAFMSSLKAASILYHLQPYPGTKVFEENKDKILAKFGSLHNFFCVLGDNADFVINLTNWTDDEYFIKKFALLRKTKAEVIGLLLKSDFDRDLRQECAAAGELGDRVAALLKSEVLPGDALVGNRRQ